MVLFVINTIIGVVFYFTTDQIADAFGFKGVGVETGGVLFGITMGGIVVQLAYNQIVHYFELYKTRI